MNIGLSRRSFRDGWQLIVALVGVARGEGLRRRIVVMTSGAFTAAHLELAPGFEHSDEAQS